jgi:hypothetical protein
MRPESGARSLHFGRDDGNVRFTFVQCGGSNEPVNMCWEHTKTKTRQPSTYPPCLVRGGIQALSAPSPMPAGRIFMDGS